ncbi:MAG: universal stress protein [Planctomycetota bacterium]
MQNPSANEFDAGLGAARDLFERARVAGAEPLEIVAKTPSKVLLALDGSPQDGTGEALAATLKDRFGCAVAVADCRDGAADGGPQAGYDAGAAGRLGGEAVSPGDGEAYERVLAAVGVSGCDLLVVPCPFGRDLDKLGADSVGTVLDVLLTRCPVPVLVVRQPPAEGADLFSDLVLPLIGENEAAVTAAGWAVGLVASPGDVKLRLVLEQEFYENLRDLLRVLDPDKEFDRDEVRRALEKEHVRLHAGLQKASATERFGYAMECRAEGDGEPASPGLLVLAPERGDHASEGHVRDRVRNAAGAVLVVCGPT